MKKHVIEKLNKHVEEALAFIFV